jgi:hypothetical protein
MRIKQSKIEFRGVTIDVVRYERGFGRYDFYYYPSFNGNFEGKGVSGFKKVCSFIRSVLSMQEAMKPIHRYYSNPKNLV